MKNIILVLVSAMISAQALATTVTITSDANNPDPKMAALADVPQAVLGVLMDQKVQPIDLGGGKFLVGAKNIHCDYRHRGAYEGVEGGIPTLKCRINSEAVQNTKKGTVLRDGRALQMQLDRLDQAAGTGFTDCAMGYCGTFVKSINCTIDTNIEEFMKGRFSCDLADEF